MLFIFSTPVFIKHLWQLKTVVFQHWCLRCTVLMCLTLNAHDTQPNVILCATISYC